MKEKEDEMAPRGMVGSGKPASGLRLCTAFAGHCCIGSGPLTDVAQKVKRCVDGGLWEAVLVFDDETGRLVEIDVRGSEEDVAERVQAGLGASEASESSLRRGPGRPKLGVLAREVTLLPAHWDWLDGQPGGASAALRRLVHGARRSSGERDRARLAQEAAYRVMTALAGNLPGFEEALRAFYRRDTGRFGEIVGGWPRDVGDYVRRMAAVAQREGAGEG